MTWAVTAATVGSIGGSLLGGASARKQAEAKARALAEAKGQVTNAYQTSKGYYDPYYQTGTAASNRLAELMPHTEIGYGDVDNPLHCTKEVVCVGDC